VTPAERRALEAHVLPVLRQALAMTPDEREATLGVLVAAIAASEGLDVLRRVLAAALAAAERRMAARST
jgi:hypothetical protein